MWFPTKTKSSVKSDLWTGVKNPLQVYIEKEHPPAWLGFRSFHPYCHRRRRAELIKNKKKNHSYSVFVTKYLYVHTLQSQWSLHGWCWCKKPGYQSAAAPVRGDSRPKIGGWDWRVRLRKRERNFQFSPYSLNISYIIVQVKNNAVF